MTKPRVGFSYGLLFLICVTAWQMPSAGATQVDASSTTLLAGRPDWRDGQVHTVVPFIEWVRLSATDIDTGGWIQDLRILVSAWGSADDSDFRRNSTVSGDVDIAFIQGSLLHRRLTLSLGRQLISPGAARATSLDGANVDLKIYRQLGISAYGGVPVVPRFAVARGDAMFGSRLYWRKSYDTEVGASFVQVLDHGYNARQDLGLDARYVPIRSLALNGYLLWSLMEARLAEAEVAGRWQAMKQLQVFANLRHTAPDLFLPRTSIFSVFASEERTEGGAGVFWQPVKWIGLTADYRQLWLQPGYGEDARLRSTFTLSRKQTAGAEVRLLNEPVNGYTEGRVWLRHQWSPSVVLTGDAQADFLKHAINGKGWSSTLTASGTYAFAPGWNAGVSGLIGSTPFFDVEFQIMAKLVYSFSLAPQRSHP